MLKLFWLILLFPTWLLAAQIEPPVLIKESVLAKAMRADPVMGPEMTMPANATGRMRIALDLDAADLEDPGYEAVIELWVHNGKFYEKRIAIGYRGGKHSVGPGGIQAPPGFWLNQAWLAGKNYRVRVVPVKKVTNVGATVEK